MYSAIRETSSRAERPRAAPSRLEPHIGHRVARRHGAASAVERRRGVGLRTAKPAAARAGRRPTAAREAVPPSETADMAVRGSRRIGTLGRRRDMRDACRALGVCDAVLGRRRRRAPGPRPPRRKLVGYRPPARSLPGPPATSSRTGHNYFHGKCSWASPTRSSRERARRPRRSRRVTAAALKRAAVT